MGKIFFCDAHFHAAQCAPWCRLPYAGCHFAGASCSHSKEEFCWQENCVHSWREQGILLPLFGIHPQQPDIENASFMEQLLADKRIVGVGEAGFDFFTAEYRSQRVGQESAWDISLSLAQKYGVPVVVHNRKALDLMFRDSKRLAGLPSVVFHSFAFGPREAQSLLSHGINAYFSFGKQILNGNKKSIACVKNLPLERLLFETDAPYQTLRGELVTKPEDLVKVYNEACSLRNLPAGELAEHIQKNFESVFRTRLGSF